MSQNTLNEELLAFVVRVCSSSKNNRQHERLSAWLEVVYENKTIDKLTYDKGKEILNEKIKNEQN